MNFVLDASVTMSWCFSDEATPYADAVLDRLQTATAVVPAIWPLEVVNVLLAAERRKRLTEAQSRRFVELLAALPIEVEHPVVERIFTSVLALGREHGLSAYDAAYAELAARRGLALATRDERVRAAAAAIGVEVLA
ncbi:MAG: type II toxin-antitoxin system VapC family toxin [Armatimonadetes bacterium]|nr:type II toxin-antitoxin system VapC family toxin [Armatimonadota bacterium]